MPDESACMAKLEESVRENPANRSYCLAAVSHALERISFDALAGIVSATPAPATCTVRPKNAVTNLVRLGGLEQTIEVDGRPYEGSSDDLLADETITAESEVVYYVETTASGRALLDSMGASARIDDLFTGKPSFAPGFLAVLDQCAAHPGGTPKGDIEKMLRAHPDALRVDGRTGLETVSPSFYLTNLEDAGALEWADGLWHITEAGAAALAERSDSMAHVTGEEGAGA